MTKLIDKIKEKGAGFADNSWMLVYAHDRVILEKFDMNSDAIKDLTLKDIKEARIFNNDDELKIWHYQGELKSRLFSETGNSNDEESYNETMLLQEPFKKQGTKIHVKNYYKFDENGLIQFQDARITEVL